MSTTGHFETGTEAIPYVEAVRARISGLPAAQQADLLQDLDQHLAELIAESTTTLTQRLADPDEFATEYLSSAEIDIPDHTTESRPKSGRLRRMLRWIGRIWILLSVVVIVALVVVVAYLVQLVQVINDNGGEIILRNGQ
jgi:uncharacterized membrane protein